MRRALWRHHPGVRSGTDLTLGERAADHLKAAFGSWSFLIILNVFIVGWIALNAVLPRADRWDIFPFILLNLGLSWLAAQQGGALQIAANRGDRISSELAAHTYEHGQKILALAEAQAALLSQNTDLTAAVKHDTELLEEIHRHVTALAPEAGKFAPGKETP